MTSYADYQHIAEVWSRFIRDVVASAAAGTERREALGIDAVRSLVTVIADEVAERAKAGATVKEEST